MIWLISSFAALGGCLYGYDLGLIGGALLDIREEFKLSTLLEESIVGSAKFGALAATFLGGAMMKLYGRRITIAADSLLFFAGPIMMAFASGPAMLIAGRVVVGMGIGVNAVVVPAYLGEVAPADTRGRVVMVYELSLAVGMLAASAADTGLQLLDHNWRWMVGLPCIPGLFIALALVLLPESPRWLVVQGKLDAALAAMHRIHTSSHLPAGQHSSTAEVEAELLELWSNVEKERAESQARAGANASHLPPHKGLLAIDRLDEGASEGGSPGDRLQEQVSRSVVPLSPSGQAGQATKYGDLVHSHPGEDEVDDMGKENEETQRLVGAQEAGGSGRSSAVLEGETSEVGLPDVGQSLHVGLAGDTATATLDWDGGLLGDQQLGAGDAGVSHSGGWGDLAAEAAALPRLRTKNAMPENVTASDFVVVDLGPAPDGEKAGTSGAEVGRRHGVSETERDLRDPSSPLHRALSAVPASLPPIRVRAPPRPPPAGPTSPAAAAALPPQQHRGLSYSGSEAYLLQLAPGGPWGRFRREVSRFGRTLVEMVRDIYLVGFKGSERRSMTIAFALAFFNQAIASSAIVNYAPVVLHSIGVSSATTATALTSGVTLAKGMGVWVSILLVDRVGRRPLLIWGSIGCAVGMLVIAVGVHVFASWLVLLGMGLYMFAFSCSHAGVFWVVISEIFSMSAKSAAVSGATATLFLVGALTNTVFLSMYHKLQWGAFIIFGLIAACAAVFCFVYLPETKGRTLLEVQALLSTPGQPKDPRHSHPGHDRPPAEGVSSSEGTRPTMVSSSLLRSANGEAVDGIGFREAGEGVRQPGFLQRLRLWAGNPRFES